MITAIVFGAGYIAGGGYNPTRCCTPTCHSRYRSPSERRHNTYISLGLTTINLTDKTLYIPVTTHCDGFLFIGGGDRIEYDLPPH